MIHVQNKAPSVSYISTNVVNDASYDEHSTMMLTMIMIITMLTMIMIVIMISWYFLFIKLYLYYIYVSLFE